MKFGYIEYIQICIIETETEQMEPGGGDIMLPLVWFNHFVSQTIHINLEKG